MRFLGFLPPWAQDGGLFYCWCKSTCKRGIIRARSSSTPARPCQFGAPIREAPIGKARREGAVLAATDEPAPRQSAPQGLVQRCKGSEAFEYRNAARLAGRANRQALFDKIRELYNAGKTVSAIAREVGFGRKSVDRWVRLVVLPVRTSMMPKTQSTPAYHEAFLLRRWAEGMTNGRRLFTEIPQRGYTGSYSHFSEAPCAVEGSRHPPNA
jgi:hypothetical protein